MKGYWISLYTKIENQENLKKYAELNISLIRVVTLGFVSHHLSQYQHLPSGRV